MKRSPDSPPSSYYPVFANLSGRLCVVVGGGRIAERKVLSVVSAGACVRVISPDLTARLKKLRDRGVFEHIGRQFIPGDTKGAFLVIAATSDESVNRSVSQEAPGLVNAVDMPHLGNFIVPSVLRRGPLTIAVSTSGASPAFARTIRRELERSYTADFGHFMTFFAAERKKSMLRIRDKKERECIFKGCGSEEVLMTLRNEGIRAAKQKVKKILGQMRSGENEKND